MRQGLKLKEFARHLAFDRTQKLRRLSLPDTDLLTAANLELESGLERNQAARQAHVPEGVMQSNGQNATQRLLVLDFKVLVLGLKGETDEA